MTTSTCPNRHLSPPSDAPMLGGREEKRDRERGTQKAMTGLTLHIFLPPSFHTIYRQTAESSPWATGHVVYSLRGCSVFLFFIPLYSVT